MTITVEWDDPNRTMIRYTFGRTWTVEEFLQAYPLAEQLLRASQTHVIGIIVDDSAEQMPPRGAMTAFRRTVRDGRLPIVFVSPNPASKSMMQTLARAYKSPRLLFYVETLEEARALLGELSASSGEH